MDLAKLKEPFTSRDVSWRVGQAGKNAKGIWCKVLCYLDNRAIMDRLDSECGPGNWRNEFRAWTVGTTHGVLCGISIRIGDEWVTKWDGADNTDIEAVKGGLSDSMKRAAVQWGIGRYLYDLGETWAETATERPTGKDKDEWKYASSKELGAYYWKAPALPAWAVGQGPAPASQPPAAPPKAAPKAASKAPTYQEAKGIILSQLTPEDALQALTNALRNDFTVDDQMNLRAVWFQRRIELMKPEDVALNALFADEVEAAELSQKAKNALYKLHGKRVSELVADAPAAA